MKSGSAAGVGAAALMAALALAWAAQQVGSPGPYYDEAFLAQQARGFLVPERAGPHPPGTSEWMLFGRPLPLRNAAYLGALKSLLAIPALAVFGAELATWRLTTFVTALLAWGAMLLWLRRCAGTPVALATGLLVLCDPAFLLFGLYEWGPFTTLLLCRCAGALCLTEGWLRGRRAWLVAGGGLLGLGVFARADFALVVAAGALAALAARPELLRRLWAERRGDALAAAGAALVGALPMLWSLPALLQTGRGIADRGDLADKARVLWSTLDGSHFLRLMEVGGLFDAMFERGAPMSLLGVAALLAFAGLVAAARRGGRALAPIERFALVATALLAPAMWLLPGAVRAHHMLNLMPLPHLVVALALARLGAFDRRAPAAPGLRRAAAGAALLAVVASQLWLVARTDALIERTGGRGRFSDAIQRFAAGVEPVADASVVSLDWGFHEPLLFLTERVPLHEPIWSIVPALAAGRAWHHDGDGATRYLVHEARYDLFGLGPKLLRSARRLPEERRTIEPWTDREGGTAFVSVRFPFPHRLVFNGAFFVKPR